MAIAVAGALEPSGAPPVQAAHPRPSTGRLLFRFGLGIIDLGGQGLAAMLRGPGEIGGAPPPSMVRHALVGAAIAAPDALRALGRRAGLRRAGVRARRLAGRGAGLLHRTAGGRRLAARLAGWGARASGALATLAVSGQREQAAAQALARGVFGRLFAAAVAQLAESADLKRVIHEQSEGLASEAILGLRDQSMRADDLVEAVASRFLGRRRRRPK